MLARASVRRRSVSIGTADDLIDAILDTLPGDRVTPEIVRGTDRRNLDITIGERPTGT